MTLRSAIRLAKPNGTERSVPYSFFLAYETKRPLLGQSGVLDVNFDASHNFFLKNDQKRQIKAVLSIFENS